MKYSNYSANSDMGCFIFHESSSLGEVMGDGVDKMEQHKSKKAIPICYCKDAIEIIQANGARLTKVDSEGFCLYCKCAAFYFRVPHDWDITKPLFIYQARGVKPGTKRGKYKPRNTSGVSGQRDL